MIKSVWNTHRRTDSNVESGLGIAFRLTCLRSAWNICQSEAAGSTLTCRSDSTEETAAAGPASRTARCDGGIQGKRLDKEANCAGVNENGVAAGRGGRVRNSNGEVAADEWDLDRGDLDRDLDWDGRTPGNSELNVVDCACWWDADAWSSEAASLLASDADSVGRRGWLNQRTSALGSTISFTLQWPTNIVSLYSIPSQCKCEVLSVNFYCDMLRKHNLCIGTSGQTESEF